ncbi:MAG: hypothetical protein HOW73_51225 [Polyangiaceae bacterium]|nr:hypothetical protein [Polyangiaceae bacterium]
MKALKFLPAVALLFVVPAYAQTSNPVAHFTGTDGDWFNAANWSTGSVPGAGTDVVIDGSDVVIDPAQGSAGVAIRDLTVTGGGSLTTLPGTVLETRAEHLSNGGELFFRSSGSLGGTFEFQSACSPTNPTACALEPWSNLKYNPTAQSKRTSVLKSSFPAVALVVQFGLGGVTPASVKRAADGSVELHAGAGHYATLNAETIELGAYLTLALHYDFEPVDGDSFEIIRAKRSLSGEFIDLPEGELVACTDSDVGLYISYAGNAVTLDAEDTDPADCMSVPAVQRVGSRR